MQPVTQQFGYAPRAQMGPLDAMNPYGSVQGYPIVPAVFGEGGGARCV